MKTVVITGSARGFGYEMIKLFRGADFNTVLCDINEESLKKAKVPCFFIHGKADETVPFSHAEANYEACCTEKEKYFIDDVLHAQAYYYGGEDLKNKLIDFLRKHVDGE